jgi:NifU-like protein involved in Fe-S cluster formation
VTALSRKADERLRRPRTRGTFLPVEAARRRLGLLRVADGGGQASIAWLVDLSSSVIEDARFLAFGGLASHPLADAFTELVRGRTVADACALTGEQVESLLRDDPLTPAVPAGSADFLRDLQDRALAALPTVALLPPPPDAPTYVRKRRQDWTPADGAWLPLGLMQKMQRVQTVADRVLAAHFPGVPVTAEITGLHDDFQVAITLKGLAPEQVPTAGRFLEDSLRGELHPGLAVAAE